MTIRDGIVKLSREDVSACEDCQDRPTVYVPSVCLSVCRGCGRIGL